MKVEQVQLTTTMILSVLENMRHEENLRMASLFSLGEI